MNKLSAVVTVGYQSDALKFQKQHGGQVYTGRNQAWFTVEGGKRRGIFWHPEKGEPVRADTYALAIGLGITIAEHPDLTPSKLTKLFIREILGFNPDLDKKQGKRSAFYGSQWAEFAQKSSSDEEGDSYDHWHFSDCCPHDAQWLVDRDIQTAFFSAMLSAQTLFLFEHKNGTSQFIDDGGAMARLRELAPTLPKWFKHRLVGTLASYKHGIKWGAAFNTAHWAIDRVYKFMAQIREIAGEYGVRYFVDCVTLLGVTPAAIIDQIDAAALAWGFTFRTKALGYGQLWSPVEGFIGWQNPIGMDFEVASSMKERNLHYDHRAFTREMVQNFGLRLVTHSLHLPDRTVYGHWNGAAFWSLAQPVSGMVESKSQWYQVYPDTLDKEKWLTVREQVKKLVKKI